MLAQAQPRLPPATDLGLVGAQHAPPLLGKKKKTPTNTRRLRAWIIPELFREKARLTQRAPFERKKNCRIQIGIKEWSQSPYSGQKTEPMTNNVSVTSTSVPPEPLPATPKKVPRAGLPAAG